MKPWLGLMQRWSLNREHRFSILCWAAAAVAMATATFRTISCSVYGWCFLISATNARNKSPPSAGFHLIAPQALSESLFTTVAPGTRIDKLSPVLFDSTRVGGPNQTSGFEAKAGSNPWDFIFMLEGSLLFAGALGRKLDDDRAPSARFPFLVNSSPVRTWVIVFGRILWP